MPRNREVGRNFANRSSGDSNSLALGSPSNCSRTHLRRNIATPLRVPDSTNSCAIWEKPSKISNQSQYLVMEKIKLSSSKIYILRKKFSYAEASRRNPYSLHMINFLTGNVTFARIFLMFLLSFSKKIKIHIPIFIFLRFATSKSTFLAQCIYENTLY